ncbi:MAG TPA: 1,4-alpha-glucan branching protein GlgB [Candidatus Thiothrix moscowensis]|uniref:1,4-alpha-glucan branching protein GlgB n=1 Tax=unclassified Thiothrix TaxID=2636184 RepID=UPI0025CE09DD|nr:MULTISPECIES: 1,4-alpha-glucan branching protein GlgB [unclassified Thiothrix]HRJ54476.1 1,4-alpha-glucan branching protein GlgB [Candidatus Thiothrix moscowensis]HRJ94823.1 1,4-alpha-glucan branching protein GlgB [Candidatus Thiothrix moscowensis]
MNEHLNRIQQGRHHDPFDWLGWHPLPDGLWALRTFMPAAEAVTVVGHGSMARLEGTDCFEAILPSPTTPATHPPLVWQDKQSGNWHDAICPYTFAPQVGELDLHLLGQGRHHHAWKVLGSRQTEVDGISGTRFVVWAPAVQRVSIVGNFNAWDGRRHPLRSRGETGIWELFIPGLQAGEAYKYEILNRHGNLVTKTDPYAQQMFMRPETASCIAAADTYGWQDNDWVAARAQFDWQHSALSIYELHPGSWRKHPDGRFYSWADLTESLIPYIQDLNYTHIELMPVAEHPLDESWGYQVSGYYAPTARYGSADDFRAFVDACHQAGIGVLLDWVPAHFPKDDFALARFTGEPLYEHADPRRGEHQDWGTLIFDFGRNEVKNFLISNALYWIEEFHIDGLRVDAVASMLYLDYSRKDGEWLPNQYGGRENIEAIAFLREMNTVVHGYFPGVLTIAEESTSWPAVSRPVEIGGLGFSMKWNMGWMNDNLSYIEQNPVHRKYHHNLLTFSQMYAYSENFVLPLSHDEVVHLKHSMLNKMPGDYWQAFANLRLFYAWHYAHPGKKLLFMGGEFGQWAEWNVKKELDWALISFPAHDSIRHLLRDLNRQYRDLPALHQYDFDGRGFQWVDCHDSDQSVLSLIRQGSEPHDKVVILLNFTPVPRYQYRIGVPVADSYREILNTDSEYYGGSNCGNAGMIPVQPHPWMGFEHSVEVTLPPLAALFLQAC